MKKIISILVFILLFCATNAQTKTYYANGKLKDIGFYDKEKHKTDQWKYYFNTGDLEKIEEYKNGQVTVRKNYYKGLIRSEEYFKNGKKNGEWKYYNQQNGKLKQIDHYLDNKPVGVSKWFHKNGNLGYIRYYLNGKAVGEHKEYYESGNIKEITTFVNGKISEIISYYENGSLSAKRTFLEDKILARSFYEIDQKMGSIGYNQNIYGTPQIGKWKYYHQNGKLHYKGKYIEGKRTGKWKGYHNNGKRKFKGKYNVGKQIGKWNYYLENGKLEKIEHWVNDKLILIEKK